MAATRVSWSAARRLLRTLHLALGLTAGLLLSLTGITGSLLVFRPEIEARTVPALRHAAHLASPHAAPAPLERVTASVRVAFPAAPIRHLFLADGPEGTHEASLAGPRGERRVCVDPYTARVLGVWNAEDTFTGRLFALHTRLLLDEESGEPMVGYSGITLLFLSLSGVALWWPARWRQIPDRLRVSWRASPKRVNYDLHRTGGFYAACLLALIAFTGASLALADWSAATAYTLTGTRPPDGKPKAAIPPASATMRPLGELLRRADAALPGGTLRRITFPAKPGDPLVIRKRLPGEWHPNGTSFIYLDPYAGTMLRRDVAAQADRGQRLLSLRYPLHIGRWGGIGTRLLYAGAGLMPALLFLTGCRIWWTRTLANRRRRQQRFAE